MFNFDLPAPWNEFKVGYQIYRLGPFMHSPEPETTLQVSGAMPAASPVAVTPGALSQLPTPAAAGQQMPPSAPAASLPPPSPPQHQGEHHRASGGGGSSPRGVSAAVSNNRAALVLIPSKSTPLPPHSCAPNSSSAHGTVIAATPSIRSSVASAGSQPSVTAAGQPTHGAGGVIPHSRLSAGSVAAAQPGGPAVEPPCPAPAGRLAHGADNNSQAAAQAAGPTLTAAAAGLKADPTKKTAAVASLLPHTHAHGPEELQRSAAVQPPAPFPPAASPALGGAAAPGAEAAPAGEDSPLEAASELFAALASASEFACLADAELSQQ